VLKLTHVPICAVGVKGEEGKTVARRQTPPTPVDYANHFEGIAALGVIPDSGNGVSTWWAIDCDDPKQTVEDGKRILGPILENYPACHVEGGLTRGWRFYLFINQEVQRSAMLPLLLWAQKKAGPVIEMFPNGMKTITVPGFGIQDFQEILEDKIDAALSFPEFLSAAHLLPYKKGFVQTPVAAGNRDETIYDLVRDSAIQEPSTLLSAMEFFNLSFVVPPKSPDEIRRAVNSGSKANNRVKLDLSEARKDEAVGGFESFAACLKGVTLIVGEDCTFRFTVEDPFNNCLKEFEASVAQINYKATFSALALQKTGYRYRFPESKEDWQNVVDMWCRSPQEQQPFEFSRAGILLKNLHVWMQRNCISTKLEALRSPKGTMFLTAELDTVYVHADVFTEFMGAGAEFPFSLKLGEIPKLLSALIRNQHIHQAYIGGYTWYGVSVEASGLKLRGSGGNNDMRLESV
jgi:hypothetical protein